MLITKTLWVELRYHFQRNLSSNTIDFDHLFQHRLYLHEKTWYTMKIKWRYCESQEKSYVWKCLLLWSVIKSWSSQNWLQKLLHNKKQGYCQLQHIHTYIHTYKRIKKVKPEGIHIFVGSFIVPERFDFKVLSGYKNILSKLFYLNEK